MRCEKLDLLDTDLRAVGIEGERIVVVGYDLQSERPLVELASPSSVARRHERHHLLRFEHVGLRGRNLHRARRGCHSLGHHPAEVPQGPDWDLLDLWRSAISGVSDDSRDTNSEKGGGDEKVSRSLQGAVGVI